jgi:uncharacterized cupredoxin-like copper-binding protein
VSEPPVPTARRLARGAAALAICAAFLTACGGDDSADTQASTNSGSSSGGQTITATEADFSISLDQKGLTAGTYDIEVVNDGGATHDLVVEKDGKDIGKTDAIGPGKSTTLTVTLESGDYVFYCSIGNHRAMGMELTVRVT